ncbi:MAG: GAF domain-containing sensor histidine kinase [Spirulinaceae cyanobacterium]
MAQVNVQKISDRLLQLTTVDHIKVDSRLVALAECLGQGLGAQACRITPPTVLAAELPCFWYEAALDPNTLPWDSLFRPAGHSHPLVKQFTCANGTTIRLAHGDAAWQPQMSTEQFHNLLNTAAIAYAHLQLCQQNHYQQSIQDVINHFSQTFKASPHLEDLLPATLRQLGQVLPIGRSFVLLLKYKNPFGRSLIPQARIQIAQEWQDPNILRPNDPDDADAPQSFLLADAPVCLQAWHGAPEPLEVNQAPPLNAKACDRWLDWLTFPQLLLIPLLGAAQANEQRPLVLGFMGFQRQNPLDWSATEQALLDWVGSQISTALIHNNTLEQVQNLVDTRTAQLKGSLEVQARLYEKTRQQVEQLQELITLKNEFLDSVGHELRTPLTSMKVAIRMLRQTNLPADRQTKYLDLLEQEWQREFDLIQNLLSLQQMESSESLLPLQEIAAASFINQLAQPFEQRWQPQGLSLQVNVPPDLQLYSHASSLERIINELLTNAGKYADPNTTIRLGVTLKDATVELAVHNWGQGISPESQRHIFEKFFRGKGVAQRAIGGTGLGLAIVKALVKHLNGTIKLWSAPATHEQMGQTQFTIVIPHKPAPCLTRS